MDKLLLTIGLLIVFALLFAGVNIGLILLSIAALISVANAVLESIEKKQKKNKDREESAK
jgi:hypothetical protein